MATPQRSGGFSIQGYVLSCMTHVERGAEAGAGHKVVDLHFATFDVDVAKAQARGHEFVDWLYTVGLPPPRSSYIDIGAMVGSQDLALQVMAVGDALGVWGVYTPADQGMEGAEADSAAGSGGVTIGAPRDLEAFKSWASGPSQNGHKVTGEEVQ